MMGFNSLTSLTDGGGLNSSSSSSADGDNTFSNGFNYKGGGNGDNTLIIVGLLCFVSGFVVAKVM